MTDNELEVMKRKAAIFDLLRSQVALQNQQQALETEKANLIKGRRSKRRRGGEEMPIVDDRPEPKGNKMANDKLIELIDELGNKEKGYQLKADDWNKIAVILNELAKRAFITEKQ